MDRWVQSASILHSNGDALDIAVRDGAIVGVRGRGVDRVNRGRLGPKDLYGWQANGSADRLTRPLIRRNGCSSWKPTGTPRWTGSWHAATSCWTSRGPSAIGFYTSGQLFLEEYYTLGIIAQAAIGTNHVDGNTRLCTATAAEALKESFGCDGQPGSYTDVDHADVIALFGHNVAETQTVLWTRMLDRLAGPNPPAIVCVDPRPTPVAPERGRASGAAAGHQRRADERPAARDHRAQLGGPRLRSPRTRSASRNSESGSRHYTPEQVADDLRRIRRRRSAPRPELLGTTDRLLSTVLQGFYQSHQATAAAVQVNNLHLVRGMLGRPGCGVLQMNGQPTAENTRECGADGDLAGFRNWANDEHIAELARLWNIDVDQIPHYAPPTHAMQMFRYAEQGTLRLLWISATNPAVSLPELARIRSILSQDRLFVVVQDMFLTETAELADVVLPAATWGEKTGTFTNADRTVHLSEKAVDPPGRGAIRSGHLPRLRPADGLPRQGRRPVAVPGRSRRRRSRRGRSAAAGRPCDYTGLSYERCAAAAASNGPAPRSTPTVPNGSTPTGPSAPTPITARPTARTWSPVLRSNRPSTGRSTRMRRRSSRPPNTFPLTKDRPSITRSR